MMPESWMQKQIFTKDPSTSVGMTDSVKLVNEGLPIKDYINPNQLTEEQYRELLEEQWRKDQIYRRNPRMCPVFCGHF